MPEYLGNFPNAWVSEKFPNLENIPPSNTYRNLGNFPNAWVSVKFLKYPGIWEVSKILKIYHPQMTGFLGNFQNLKNIPPSNAKVSRKFPKCLGICEISQIHWHLKNFQNLKNIPPWNTYRNLGNFQNAWVSGNFPKFLGIWEISQMPGYLGNFPNAWVAGKFLKCLGLGNFPNIQSFEKFPKS